jgi:hypothetical protein
MAHIINLATQVLISTYSKAPDFDPKNPENHLPDTAAAMRDEIGLVRAIAVKVSQTLIMLSPGAHFIVIIGALLSEAQRSLQENPVESATERGWHR